MSVLVQPQPRVPPDGLFLERLDAFFDKSLIEIKQFAEREQRPFDEIRHLVSEWHYRHLFQINDAEDFSKPNPARSVLFDISNSLQSLYEVSGVQSFFLAVDPGDQKHEGFLGGSVAGREFWRGLRGGGEVGAKNFKIHCLKTSNTGPGDKIHVPPTSSTLAHTTASGAKRGPASSVKVELYSIVREALRAASGVRNAEMKWTNHHKLSTYGVRLDGWPDDIPVQNPSSLSASQNKSLLDSFRHGETRFLKIGSSEGTEPIAFPETAPLEQQPEDLSWALKDTIPDFQEATNNESLELSGVEPRHWQSNGRSFENRLLSDVRAAVPLPTYTGVLVLDSHPSKTRKRRRTPTS